MTINLESKQVTPLKVKEMLRNDTRTAVHSFSLFDTEETYDSSEASRLAGIAVEQLTIEQLKKAQRGIEELIRAKTNSQK